MSEFPMTQAPTTHLKRSLGLTGLLAQSLAGIAPTATPTVNVEIIFCLLRMALG